METESITAPDAEETAMRDLGFETDQAQGRATETPTETPRETPVDTAEGVEGDTPPLLPTETPERPESPEIPEPQRDRPQQVPRDPVTGKFQRPDSEYSRAQKEEIRKARTWQNIQAEKEQIRLERSQWEEQRRLEQLEATRKQYQPLRKDGLTAQEYYQGAKVFEREGDFENAYKAHQVAQQMFTEEQQRLQQMQGVEAEYQWRTQMQQVMQREPSVADPNSPISQHLGRIIEQNPWLYHVPGGFTRAAEVAWLLSRESRMKEMEDELIAVKAENEKYRRKSQPSKGGYASPRTGDKDFDEMGLDEQEAHLKHLTAEADAWR